ncbi:MAG: ester cyclase [Candidatus Scalindua sp.]
MISLNKKQLLLKLTVLLTVFFVIVGCQQNTDYSAELKPLVDKYNSAWETGNVDGLDAIFDPNFVRHADKGSSADGIENLKKVIKAFKTAYPDLKLIFSEEFYGENQYAGHWSFTGTNTGPGEIPPTGKSVSQWGVNIIHFKDGKIVEEWDGFDNVPILKQLGYTILPPTEGTNQ